MPDENKSLEERVETLEKIVADLVQSQKNIVSEMKRPKERIRTVSRLSQLLEEKSRIRKEKTIEASLPHSS
jgi:glycerophosphoryl diester phosphodiesterase